VALLRGQISFPSAISGTEQRILATYPDLA
jgi:hypothetical protein